MDQVKSVIVAATQSVAKVYVIGAVGWISAKYPRKHPLLTDVASLARFSFHTLTVALVYSTVSQSISPETITQYWFCIVSAAIVTAISYGIATLFAPLFLRIRKNNEKDIEEFVALRIAVTYPNIVALPILIFPSLCEYPVVYQGFFNNEPSIQQCIQESNTMIFTYFFCWSILFWMHAYPSLVYPTKRTNQAEDGTDTNQSDSIHNDNHLLLEEEYSAEPINNDRIDPSLKKKFQEIVSRYLRSLWQTISSPGCLALFAGIITGCIPGLADLLFPPGAPLRFLGDSISTMGQASSPVSTMVVAASLVVVAPQDSNSLTQNQNTNDTNSNQEEEVEHHNEQHDRSELDVHPCFGIEQLESIHPDESQIPIPAGGIMSDPNYLMQQSNHRACHHCQQKQSRIRRLSRSIQKGSARILQSWQQNQQEEEQNIETTSNDGGKHNLRSLLIWYTLSRLIATPAVVTGIIVGLDCGGWLDTVPNLAKLVVIINSCLPGALIVVVLLQQQNKFSDAAMVIAKVYLPTYLLSIVTIAGWTALGLWVTLPDDEGNTVCHR